MNKQKNDRQTFMRACEKGNADKVSEMLADKNFHFEVRNNDDAALRKAINGNHLKVIEILIDFFQQRQEPYFADFLSTAITLAIIADRFEATNLIVEKLAFFRGFPVSRYDETILMNAISMNKGNLVIQKLKILKENNFEKFSKNLLDIVVDFAVRHQRKEVLGVLLASSEFGKPILKKLVKYKAAKNLALDLVTFINQMITESTYTKLKSDYQEKSHKTVSAPKIKKNRQRI